MHTLRAGVWYLVYNCKACHRKQVLFPDLSNGQVDILGTYGVHCPECGHQAYYGPEKIERYQHQLKSAASA